MKRTGFAIFITLSLLASITSADAERDARIEAALQKVLPDAKVTKISPAPLPGMYEVMIGPALLYVSEDGRYVFKGDVFDLESLENITDTRQAEERVDAFAKLGVDSMIEFAPSKNKTLRTVYVYTDIDCGYCRKMHREVEQLNDAGIVVRYLAYPRSGIGGESYDKAVSVWCATNRKKALTDAKSGKALPTSTCDNPVTDHYRMGEAMGLRGTPAVYSDDGEPMGGYIPAQQLIRMLTVTGR